MIGVGIIGAGFIGEAHANAIAALDGLELRAACRNDGAALEGFCRRHACRGYRDYRVLLDQPDVDAVVVATPHHLHTQIVLDTASAGKPLMLEKPMATTLHECDLMVEAVNEAGIPATVSFVNRFAPAYQAAQRILDSGQLGVVEAGVSTMAKFWMEENRRPWHLTSATGGGMWLTAGIHCLDRLTWLVGSNVQKVSARFRSAFHEQEADDLGMVFIRYEGGAAGTVVSTGYAQGAPNHLTELTCTGGMMTIDYQAGVAIGRNGSWQRVERTGSADWMPEAFREQWRQFREAIVHGDEGPVTMPYGRHVMAAALAALESSQSNAEVTLGC